MRPLISHQATARSCQCQCHANPYLPCDTPGGCGIQHTSRADTCPVCPALRPDADPRLPRNPPVCDGDRRLLDRWLGEIGDLVAELTNPEPPIVDDRQHERFGIVYFEGGIRHIFSRGLKPSDPVAVLGGAGPINSRPAAPSVTGSRERPIPINTAALDLTAGRHDNEHIGDAWPEDQIGHLSAATVLDAWVRDIRDRLMPDQHLPAATVGEMVMWLRARVDTVCDQHPDIADFALAVRMLRSSLRRAAGQVEPKPEPCEGVPCRRCDLITLYRQPGGDVTCINPDCQAILRDDEYHEWVKEVAEEHRQARHAAADA